MLDIQAMIFKPYYDIGGRKYIDLRYEDGRVTRVKVPYRYNRVMCLVHGLKTIQEFVKGDNVRALIEDRNWKGESFPVLHSIREFQT
jgi:hypothetical protein